MDARRYTKPRIPSNDADNLVQSPEGLPPALAEWRHR
jgi:hypothetical protein